MYLFGSRGFGTGSPRSDIDILLDTDKPIRPADLRQFASGELAALDLFLMEGGRATSAQNESYIQADNLSTLVQLLKAKKIWGRKTGRLGGDISWRQEVRLDVKFVPTALPMSPESDREDQGNIDTITLGQVLRATPMRRLVLVFAGMLSFLSALFFAGVRVGQSMG